MSQKGLYKKTIGSGWDHSPDSQRPREKRFFEKAENGQVLIMPCRDEISERR